MKKFICKACGSDLVIEPVQNTDYIEIAPCEECIRLGIDAEMEGAIEQSYNEGWNDCEGTKEGFLKGEEEL